MRLPRDWDGMELASRLRRLGYRQTRQSGSHVRLTRREGKEEHHVTVPLHSPLKIGTLAAILAAVAETLEIGRDELLRRLQ